MKKYNVGVIGATGYVGQRLVNLLDNHPFFQLKYLFASQNSANKTYNEALKSKQRVTNNDISEKVLNYIVYDLKEIANFKDELELVFCAVNLPKEELIELEVSLAKLELVVVSNNSAHRMVGDIPVIIPEINADHLEIIPSQKKRLGTKKGYIVCKPNCSIQSYVPAINALKNFKPKRILVSTYQAISGAGKSFESWPEMKENLIPFIGGEEEKSEQEPLKIWGSINKGIIEQNGDILISAQCYRVAVQEGHTASVWVEFEQKPTIDEIIKHWQNYVPQIYNYNLPTQPTRFLTYHAEENRPQVKLDVNTDKGMSIHIGRLREDTLFHYKFTCLSHNTLRGAAGGALLTAELLAKKDLI